MSVPDHFKALGLAQGATDKEVRAAYRKLAREGHPNRFTSADEKARAEETFARMTSAFNVLTDPDKRKKWEEDFRQAASGESAQEREAKTYYKGGVAKMNAGEYSDAVRLLKGALHLDSDPATYHAHLAKALEKTDAFGDAARAWDEAIKREPYNAKYYRMAGECLEHAGMSIKARRMYEAALKWSPDDKAVQEAIERVGGKASKKPGGFFAKLFSKSRSE